jgi:hypothetical protein
MNAQWHFSQRAGLNPRVGGATNLVRTALKARPAQERKMFRKTMFALTAAVALGTAALAPTSASAWGFHGGWGHGGWGPHFGGPRLGFYGGGYVGCWRNQWVATPYGPVLQRVNVCY